MSVTKTNKYFKTFAGWIFNSQVECYRLPQLVCFLMSLSECFQVSAKKKTKEELMKYEKAGKVSLTLVAECINFENYEVRT